MTLKPSKLNTTDAVPATPAEVRPAVPTTWVLPTLVHAADVAVIQLLLAQSARANTAVTVASVDAKFMPVRLTLAEAEATL